MPDPIPNDSGARPTLSPPADYRDVPSATGLPWWRYAFPTLVDLVAVCGLIALLWSAKLRGDWAQLAALALIGLLAGVRSADLSSMVRGGPGVPPSAGPAALVLAGLGSLLARGASSSGRATGAQLATALVVIALLALALPTVLVLTGGVR
jgi:hypothetical protein